MYSLACAQIWPPSSDTSTRLPFTAALAVEQGGQDAAGQRQRRRGVGNGGADGGRLASVAPGGADHSPRGLATQVGALALARRAPRGRGAAGGVDDPGVGLAALLVGEAPLVQGARPEVGHQDVGTGDECVHGPQPAGVRTSRVALRLPRLLPSK